MNLKPKEMFSAARSLLEYPDVEFEIGTWFLLGPDQVSLPSGQPFSAKPRRVLTLSPIGPNTLAFARSRSRETELAHDGHAHYADQFRCEIELDGYVTTFSVVVQQENFTIDTFSCEEPDDTGLVERIKAVVISTSRRDRRDGAS